MDEEIQKNDLDIIRQVAAVKDPVAISRAYDFSFALEADRQLAGWQP